MLTRRKAETVHYVIEDGGHGWPCPPMYDISASELAWAFFKAHRKP